MSFPMLPCISKQLFGISCPLCGFQRSLLCLLQGNIFDCIKFFPPFFFLLFTVVVSFVCYLRKKSLNFRFLKVLWICLAVLLVGNAIYQNLAGL